LTRLDLSGTGVTDAGVATLCNLEVLASLQVTGTPVTYACLEKLDAALPYAHFCEEKAIAELETAGIQVVGTPRWVEGDSARGLWMTRSGEQADFVVVGMNRQITLTQRDVENLGHLQSLKEITMHTVQLSPSGLANLRPLAGLKTLEIWFVDLSDRDLEAVARQPQLENLSIYEADSLTDAGVKHLQSLKKLKRLRINECGGITKEAISALQTVLPECDVKFSVLNTE
jgi:hypothetical protein